MPRTHPRPRLVRPASAPRQRADVVRPTAAVDALALALLLLPPLLGIPAIARGDGPAPATSPAAAATRPAGPVGAFAAHADVGRVGRPGSAAFDEERREYRVTGC